MRDRQERASDTNVVRACLISGVIQHYAWGKKGSASLISRFVAAVQEKPYAELWFGAHPKGASPIIGTASTLANLIATHPDETVGAPLSARFGATLPFMFKILSIERALSIQAHPNVEQARELHQRAPELYPDANHKPEIAIALSPVRLLFGFKSISEIEAILSTTQELRELIRPLPAQQEVALLRNYVQQVLDATPAARERAGRSLAACFKGRVKKSSSEENFLILTSQYEMSDPGLLLSLLLNSVTLQPGEALCVPAGVLHAYLSGDIAECMANSDNVVRAGLTEKPCDREALFKITNFSSFAPAIVHAKQSANETAVKCYETGASEFEVALIESSEGTHTFSGGPTLFFCSGGRAIFNAPAQRIELVPGSALFIPACQQDYTLACNGARLFRARVPESC